MCSEKSFWILSSSHDITNPHSKLHTSFMVDSVTKCCDINKGFCTKHNIEMF